MLFIFLALWTVRSALEVELQCVMQAAARDYIRDRCIQLDQHAQSRQEALRSLRRQWQSILDFRQLVVRVDRQYFGMKYFLHALYIVDLWSRWLLGVRRLTFCQHLSHHKNNHVLLSCFYSFSDKSRSEVWLRGTRQPRRSWFIFTERSGSMTVKYVWWEASVWGEKREWLKLNSYGFFCSTLRILIFVFCLS